MIATQWKKSLIICMIFLIGNCAFISAQYNYATPQQVLSEADALLIAGQPGYGSWHLADGGSYYLDIDQMGYVTVYYYAPGADYDQIIVDGVPVSNRGSILSALRSSLGLAVAVVTDNLEEIIELATQAATSTALVDAPAGPMDAVFSELGLGGGLSGRLNVRMDDGSAHTGTEGAIGANNAAAVAAARYTRFHYRGMEGNIYGITLGMERETDNSRFGIIIPYDRVDYDGTAADADSFTFTPYYQYIPMREPVKIYVGPYLVYNYTFINHYDDTSFRGIGVNCAMEKFFDAFWVRAAVAGEYLDSDVDVIEDDCVFRLRTGGMIGLPISNNTEVRGYVMHTLSDQPFLGGDDDFFTIGTELVQQMGEGFALALGFMMPQGHRHLSSYTGYIGGTFSLQ